MTNKSNTAVIILAAGKSERMGTYKPLLKLDRATSFIEKIYLTYRQFKNIKIVIVANKNVYESLILNNLFTNKNTHIVMNEQLEKGRLFSIQLGLNIMPEIEYCFIQNTDNPFITIGLLNQLFKNKVNNKTTLPIYNGKNGHPVLIPKKILSCIRATTDYNLTLKDFTSKNGFNQIMVSDSSILININTPKDYSNIIKR